MYEHREREGERDRETHTQDPLTDAARKEFLLTAIWVKKRYNKKKNSSIYKLAITRQKE